MPAPSGVICANLYSVFDEVIHSTAPRDADAFRPERLYTVQPDSYIQLQLTAYRAVATLSASLR